MSGMTTGYRIALIPGDGIGAEVLPPACAVLDAVGRRPDRTITN
jgi:tartrate dehydrogenase/decarboxylase/D-malate dehydrogenase